MRALFYSGLFLFSAIIIPVYNGANYLSQAIESALNQTYENIEIIVVNDGSNDENKTELIAKKYSKVKYFKKENGGVSSALNYGIQKMRGKYFSWLSHDDVYAKDKIKTQVKQLERIHKENAIALCSIQQIDKDGKKILSLSRKNPFKENSIIEANEALSLLLKGYEFNGCSMLIPKSVFDRCGLFDENLRFSQDIFMWMKIFLNDYSLIYNSDKLVYSRIHNGQVTQTKRELYYNDSKYIYNKIINEITEKSTKEYNFYYIYAKKNAIRNLASISKDMIKNNSKVKKMSIIKIIKIKIFIIYGKIRPYLRIIYYKYIKKVSTKK